MRNFPTSIADKFVDSIDQSSPSRDQVLKAIKDGHHTAREIADATKLNLSVIIREAEILDKLYITTRPAPPVVTYWIKGTEPKGKLIRQNGKLVELPQDTLDPALKAELIEMGNAAIAAANVPVSYDVGSHAIPAGDEYRDLPLDLLIVHPLNVRGAINESDPEFQNFLASIVEEGIQEPLIVTPHENSGKFRVVMGNRRLTAASAAKLEKAPCIIRHYTSAEAELVVMMIENIQRSGLKPMQEARGFKRLYLASGKDINAVARQVGLTQSYIGTRLRLLKLAPELQEMTDRREIGVNAASLIATLAVDDQLKIRTRVAGLKLAEIKQLVENIRTGAKPPPKWKKPRLDRVTGDSENFTRSGAIRSIEKLGDAWFKGTHIRASFDDVCLDTCHGSKDETYCYTCPVPRFITSIVRRAQKASE